ncbi:MAG: hypothetical protein AB7U98_03350 [Candidatus Nitrosocosmicus sp.]
MTSTKSFSTKNAGILIVAIFSIAISLGLSQVSSVMAQQNDVVGCATDVDEESNDTEMNNARSCADEDQDKEEEAEAEESDASDSDNDSTDTQAATVSSPNNDDDDEEESDSSSDSVTTQPQNVVTSGPASADPEDNVIKPINLNKGFVSDKPLKTNNINSDQDEDRETMKVIEDKFEFKQQLKKPSAVSEIYESFDLPYTALYKNP